MPFYTYECKACDERVVMRRRVDHRHDGPVCDFCGYDTVLMITGTHIAPINGAADGHSGLTNRTRQFIESQY